ncbi:MAG: ROK family protein [Christensenellaceae bacterium]|jgi:predicted NBD/HSP70 family sugar kinase|nr:ROK family protein [Christensenellaceae bacterium]
MTKTEYQYTPAYLYHKEFLDLASKSPKTIKIALERGENEIKVATLTIFKNNMQENLRYVERYIKTMLWCYGGYKIYLQGDEALLEKLKEIYSPTGDRAFDYNFMKSVYLTDAITFVAIDNPREFPEECNKPIVASKQTNGRRIGFDAGGSDRKVTALVDGNVIFERETIWNPKLQSNIAYHISGIKDDINAAILKLDGLFDSIGISTAGIVIDGELRISSLFKNIPADDVKKHGYKIYQSLAYEYGKPVKVANDGDAAALAGAFESGNGRLLGIAMGTSLAGGYVDKDSNILGYLNELAFIPVDFSELAPRDEWSGDKGCGVMYHSQDAAIRLAEDMGISLPSLKTPAEKLRIIKDLADKGNDKALKVYEQLGKFFGYTILWLREFYDIEFVMFLGRVASGKGGDLIRSEAQQLLIKEGSSIQIISPSENAKRLGQSYAAALF